MESTASKAGLKAISKSVTEIKFQETSLDIWESKYCLRTKQGIAVDKSMDDTYKRVATALAEVEDKPLRQHWQEQFLWALRHGAIPAGRIISNAGAQEHKPATSTINCTVSGTIIDSMEDILEKNLEAGLTLKAGCGIGYEFSTLRPKGAYVSGAGAYTSGPLSFMDIYDKTCFTVSSAGAGVVHKWQPLILATRMLQNLSAPSVKTVACASSTCPCLSPESSWRPSNTMQTGPCPFP